MTEKMIIDILTQENDEAFAKVGKKVLKCKTVSICKYCLGVVKPKKLMKCSGKDCDIDICHNCATYINHKPFCNECIADIVKNKTLILITKKEDN